CPTGACAGSPATPCRPSPAQRRRSDAGSRGSADVSCAHDCAAMLPRMTAPAVDRYAELYDGFRWHVPARFNIAEVCCARWPRDTPTAIAIRYEHENGGAVRRTYAELQQGANCLAN